MSDESSVLEQGAPAPDVETPLLQILTPGATDEEVAALVAVVAAMAAAGRATTQRPRSEWSAHHRKLRPPHRPGPGGWRSSGMP